jgi:ADP-ribosylglycohydrolase
LTVSHADPLLLVRARGALLGLVVGNQLGVPTEGKDAQSIREAFPQGVRDLTPPPQGSPFDDDAAMTLLLAASLTEKGDFDAEDVAQRWVKWMNADGRGIGFTTLRALRLIEGGKEPFEAGRLTMGPRSASNGAVMRCLPVALRYHDNLDKLVRVSTQQAAITHADERCTWGAAAVNLAARELLHGNQYFLEEVLHRLQGAPRALIEAIGRVAWEQESDLPLGVGGEAGAGYVVHCVEIAFWCALHRPSLEEALIFLAEAGGDTDTNAAVAGALLGARDGETGIPPRWLDQLGRSSVRGVTDLAERLVSGKR